MNSIGWRGGARQAGREIADGGVEQFGLFEMRGVARALEADGAGVGQGRDEMIGGVVAVELALAAMDDQGRVLDPVEQRAHVLADQAGPDRADRVGIVAGEFVRRPFGQVALAGRDRLGEDRLAGVEREAVEIVARSRCCAPRRPRA